MKKFRVISVIILSFCLLFSLTGCISNEEEEGLKGSMISGFNDLLQYFSKHALTKDINLQGERSIGED